MEKYVARLEICTKIQYNAAMPKEPVVDTARIRDEMKKLGERLGHDVKLPELAELAAVDYNTLFKAVNEENRRVSADLVTRLALVFGCSVEYLMGIADQREPVTLNLSEVLASLVAIAKTLPAVRQRDLLLMAQAYQDADDPTPEMMQELLELVEEVGDEDVRDKLAAALEARRAARNSPRRKRPSTQEGDQEAKGE